MGPVPNAVGRQGRLRAFALACALCLGGCYLAQLGAGQLRMLNGQQRMDRAIAAEQDPQRRALLQRVGDVRRYGREVMRLSVGNSYTGYYESDPEGLTHVVVGSRKTRLEPYTWWFPIAGAVPYKGYWAEAEAQAEARSLSARGYDTHVGRTTAYSTLGILRDPVVTPMLEQGLIRFVEVLLHEMAHATFYKAGQSDFNEQLASFVGVQGARDYLRSRHGHDDQLMAAVQAHYQRSAALEQVVAEGIRQLQVLYDSDASDAEKLRLREPLFAAMGGRIVALYPDQDPANWVLNNARLLQYRRYADASDYLQAMWQDSGGNWRLFWQAARGHADAL